MIGLLTTLADLFFLTLWFPLLWAVMIGVASSFANWKGRVVTLFLALVPVSAAAIYFGISYASDESFLAAGVIPWSDAAAHFSQAADMATRGITHFGMNGRFLYPAFFSSLLRITGLNLLHAEIISWIFFCWGPCFVVANCSSLDRGCWSQCCRTGMRAFFSRALRRAHHDRKFWNSLWTACGKCFLDRAAKAALLDTAIGDFYFSARIGSTTRGDACFAVDDRLCGECCLGWLDLKASGPMEESLRQWIISKYDDTSSHGFEHASFSLCL